MLNNKPGQASRKLAQTTHTHLHTHKSNNKMQLHALHTLGLALELKLKLPRQPQKAQRFIRFALLLSVKLFRKLFATENAKQINTATAAEVVLPLPPPSLFLSPHRELLQFCYHLHRADKQAAAPCSALINHWSASSASAAAAVPCCLL